MELRTRSAARRTLLSLFTFTACVFMPGGQPTLADWGAVKVFDFADGYPGSGDEIGVSGTNPTIHDGIVMFGVSGGGEQGIFRYERGSLTAFANNGPGDNFTSVSVSSSDAHNPFGAFVANQGSGNGLYTRSVNTPNVAFPIATVFTAIPSGTGNFTSIGDHSIDGQRTTFIGFGSSSQRGIYAKDVNSIGDPSLVIERFSTMPNQVDTFQSFASVSHRNNTVVFAGAGSNSSGIYFRSISGFFVAFGTVADTNTTIPGTAIDFTSFQSPSYDGSSTAFFGFGGGVSGVYTNQGGSLRTVADTNTTIPGTTDQFTSIDSGSVTHEGTRIAFEGNGPGARRGIYIENNGVLEKVIETGDVIDGRTVSGVSMGRDGYSNGHLAMRVSFDDLGSTFYAAFFEHRWDPAGGGSGDWDDPGNWPLGAKPANDVATFIQPAGPAQVTGPSTPTHMRALALGSTGAGIAELQLQPAGQVLIDETLAVLTAGKLSGSGSLHATGGINNAGEIDLGAATISLSGGTLSNTGLLRGNGQVNNTVINQASGEVRANFTDTLRMTGSGNTNHGLMDTNFGGTIESPNGLTNSASGTLAVDGVLRVGQITLITPGGVPTPIGAGLINQGTVYLDGSTRVFGDVWAEGGNDSDIIVSGGDIVTFYDDVYMYDNPAVPGKPEVRAGFNSTVVYTGLLKGDINKTGPGLHVIEGTQSAGFSPGYLAGNNELWADTSTQAFDIAGLIASTGGDTDTTSRHSVFDISGELTILDGATLAVNLIGPDGPNHNFPQFAPGLGDTFEILHWGDLTADVSRVNFDFTGAPLGPGLGWMPVWGSNANGSLTLEVVTGGLPGDLDGDGFVGINDLNLVLANWNQNVPPGNILADPSGDGFVGIADLNAVLGNWNSGTPPGGGDNVPEPTAALCFGLATSALLRRHASNTTAPANG